MYRSRKTSKAYNPERSKRLYESHQLVCPFCQLDDRPVHVETDTMRVMGNKYPYAFWDNRDVVDHLLLVPKRHVDALADFTEEERVDAMALAARYERDGYSVYSRSKTNSAKSVPHHHTHLIKVANRPARFSVSLEKPYFFWKI